MKKILLSDERIQLDGLPWYLHNNNHMWRLPNELEDQISNELWECSQNTSGGRIRFKSDTTMLGVVAEYKELGKSDNMCTIGRTGIDVYVDGDFWNYVCPQAPGEMEGLFFDNAERKIREFTIYLPLYNGVEVKKIIFDDDAVILPPSPYELAKPVVFYGTSITQGGCASRAGLSYQGMLCRELNLDFVNLGFSGLGKGERSVAEAIAQIDASCYVLDYGQNNPSIEEFSRVYEPFICKIREYRRETPILLTTPITYTSEKWNTEFRQFQNDRRQIVIDAYKSRKAKGDNNIYLVEWNKLICFQDGEGQVDGAHPNDIGLLRMSKGLSGVLSDILGIGK